MNKITLEPWPAGMQPSNGGRCLQGFVTDSNAFVRIESDGCGFVDEARVDGSFSAAELRAIAEQMDVLRATSLNEVRHG